MEDRNYGTIRIKLDEMIEKQNISKNKLAHRAEMQRTQLNQFCKGTVTRLDTAVLARLCCALNCKIENLLEYVPPENKEKINISHKLKSAEKYIIQLYVSVLFCL